MRTWWLLCLWSQQWIRHSGRQTNTTAHKVMYTRLKSHKNTPKESRSNLLKHEKQMLLFFFAFSSSHSHVIPQKLVGGWKTHQRDALKLFLFWLEANLKWPKIWKIPQSYNFFFAVYSIEKCPATCWPLASCPHNPFHRYPTTTCPSTSLRPPFCITSKCHSL